MAYGYKYYKEGEYGWDPSMPRVCPHCGGRSYSSRSLQSSLGSTGKAKCPHCGRDF